MQNKLDMNKLAEALSVILNNKYDMDVKITATPKNKPGKDIA